ncbi:MAG: ATP-binding cassette domain-containing protein [bacterium]
MGPSGCGKSTLLNILSMIERPDVGRYLYNGTDVTSSTERRFTRIEDIEAPPKSESYHQ